MSGDAQEALSSHSFYEEFERLRTEGSFVIPFCLDCQRYFWHPRKHCPRCLSRAVELREPSGTARVQTYTVNHRPSSDHAGPAVAIGYVELGEDLVVLARLDLPHDQLRVGREVRPDGHAIHFAFVPATVTGKPVEE